MTRIDELKEKLKLEQSKQIFCNFYSPGTFMSEVSSFEVKDCNLEIAAKKAKTISERHGAKPYGFRFKDGNGKSLSAMYFITGKVIRYCDVPDTSDNSIQRSNMRNNDMTIVVENKNSFRFTAGFGEKDCIVDWDGNIIRRGNEPELVHYRKNFNE